MKILFAGSSTFSMPSLEIIYKEEDLVAVLTAPDRPAGRGLKLSSSPVKDFALQHKIPVIQAERLGSQALAEVEQYKPKVLVCASYGKIFGPKFLSLFTGGTINIHPSLLPRFRGAAPIPAALLAEDTITGISLQKISLEMDCGDIIMQEPYSIQKEDTSESLLDLLSLKSATMLHRLLKNFDSMYNNAKKQNTLDAVYCQKIDQNFGTINWMESAQRIEILSRALSLPYSGVKVKYKNQILKIWKARALSDDYISNTDMVGRIVGIDKEKGILVQCRRGILALQELQLPGKKRLFWKEFISGNQDIKSSKLE